MLAFLAACAAGPAKPVVATRPAAPAVATPATVGLTEAAATEVRPGPPIRITGAGGVPLAITALRASATIDDPIATTELHLSVENPASAPLDPRLTMTLSRDARVLRVAVKRGDQIVEESAAPASTPAMTYRDSLVAGSEPRSFAAAPSGGLDAILPTLAPGERVEVIVAYAELLAGRPYELGLRGLAPLDVLSVKVDVAGDDTPAATADLAGAAPEGDVVVLPERYLKGTVEGRALAVGDYVAARTLLADRLGEQDPLLSPVVLIDTSASSTLDLAGEVGRVVELVRALPPELPIVIATYDDTVDAAYEGRAGDLGPDFVSRVASHRALGASNLEKALRWAAAQGLTGGGTRRIVLVGPGRATAGLSTTANVDSAVRALSDAGFVRADAIAPRRGRDDERLGAIVHGLGGRGAILDADLPADVLARRLQRRPLGRVPVSMNGAQSISRGTFDDARAGDTIAFVARVAHPASDVTLTVGSSEQKLPATSGAASLGAALEALASPPAEGIVFAPAGSAAPSRAALERDAALAARFTITNDAPEPDPATTSVDPLEDKVGSNVAPALPPEPASEPPPPAPADTSVEAGAEDVHGGLAPEVIRRIVRINFGRFKSCYIDALRRRPKIAGRITTHFEIAADGSVTDARVLDESSDIHDDATKSCMTSAFSKLSFPEPNGKVSIAYPIVFSSEASEAPPAGNHLEIAHATPKAPPIATEDDHYDEPYAGRLLTVKQLLARGDRSGAVREARAWLDETPADPLAYVGLGDAATASGDTMLAERAYASILDLYATRADLVRFAGEELERLPTTSALELAHDAYVRAIELRPDEPTSYRLAAFAELRLGHTEAAFRTLERAVEQKYASDAFVGAKTTLSEDLGLIGAVWAKENPARQADIEASLKGLMMGRLDVEPSMRVVLVWETESREVAVRLRDATSRPDLDQMKNSRANLKGEYGPDELSVRGPRHYPYRLIVKLGKANGPMGFTMGKVEILEHDRHGGVSFEERPFVATNGVAKIELDPIVAPRP